MPGGGEIERRTGEIPPFLRTPETQLQLRESEMPEELHADTVDGIVAAVAALRSTGLGCNVALGLV